MASRVSVPPSVKRFAAADDVLSSASATGWLPVLMRQTTRPSVPPARPVTLRDASEDSCSTEAEATPLGL